MIGRYVPLGLTLFGPVVVNILLFHIFLEPSGLPMVIVVAVLVLFLFWRYRTNFAGFLKGTVFNYEFVRAGRPMSGRFYFLKANDNTIYVLRFTGFRDKLRSIRNQTDSIGRTFTIRKG